MCQRSLLKQNGSLSGVKFWVGPEKHVIGLQKNVAEPQMNLAKQFLLLLNLNFTVVRPIPRMKHWPRRLALGISRISCKTANESANER
jgi:hypothetical protein